LRNRVERFFRYLKERTTVLHEQFRKNVKGHTVTSKPTV
jgi:hypothetical protein